MDDVKNPEHYTKGRRFEPKDVIRDWNLNFNLGNVVKYVSRAGRKPGAETITDLRKAMTYLGFEISYLLSQEGENENAESESEVPH